MKRLSGIFLVMLIPLVISSCKVNNDDESNDPNSLSGDTNVAMGQAGNTGSFGSVSVGSKYVDIGSSMQVLKNENGVATVKITADLSKDPALAAINNWIPSTVKDSTGKISTQFKAKITTEGIQTYFLEDKPHTLVKYADNVGAKYSITLGGNTYTRTVTAKSEQDDYDYGFYKIKTMTVEQTDSRMAGIKKIIYRVNHKYGIVNITFVADDGSTASAYMYSLY
mgnify:CR=1 FL=1